MTKSRLNENNEKIKENYQKYLKNERNYKLVDDTAKNKLSYVNKFDEQCGFADFKDFNADKGISFYSYLKEQNIEITTVIKYLYSVKEFLEWYFRTHKVADSKHLIDSLVVFNPTEEDKRLANRLTYIEYPTLEEFEKIIDFEEKTITDKRDRAILAFLFISCARIGAVSTTTLDLVDLKKMIYYQDPLEGVKTKRQKHIITKLLPFDDRYYVIIKEWINYLQTEHSFTDKDPLFPKIKNYTTGEEVLKKFMDGEGEYNKMLEKRCLNAGCQKYHPHAFRHFGISQALKHVRTGTQLKALSQNVGHEDICTILEQYAKMKPDRYMEVLDRMIKVKPEQKTVDEMTNAELLKVLQNRISVEKSY